jgi:hypothetical protein
MHRFSLKLTVLITLLAGCGDSEKDGSSSDGNSPSGSNCSSRCSAKATQCGAPTATAASYCTTLCAGSPTETQLGCIETTDCSTLKTKFAAGQEFCGISLKGSSGGSNCSSRCNAKATQCGAPTATAASHCNTLCAASPTETQLGCIETTDCSTLQSKFMAGQEFCGITLSGSKSDEG